MKIIKYLILAMLMAVSLSFVTEHTYAYFASSISQPADQSGTAIVSIGDWQTIPTWDPNIQYNTGDQVEYQGSIYEALKKSSGKAPAGVPNSTNFWTLVQ